MPDSTYRQTDRHTESVSGWVGASCILCLSDLPTSNSSFSRLWRESPLKRSIQFHGSVLRRSRAIVLFLVLFCGWLAPSTSPPTRIGSFLVSLWSWSHCSSHLDNWTSHSFLPQLSYRMNGDTGVVLYGQQGNDRSHDGTNVQRDKSGSKRGGGSPEKAERWKPNCTIGNLALVMDTRQHARSKGKGNTDLCTQTNGYYISIAFDFNMGRPLWNCTFCVQTNQQKKNSNTFTIQFNSYPLNQKCKEQSWSQKYYLFGSKSTIFRIHSPFGLLSICPEHWTSTTAWRVEKWKPSHQHVLKWRESLFAL